MSEHEHPNYVKIWGLLLVLLVISVLGPMLGWVWVTLLTAFGIAVVKAWMVASYYMHLKFEKKYIAYLLLTMLILVGVFFFGVGSDIMNQKGQNWQHLREGMYIPEDSHGADEHESGADTQETAGK